MSQLPLSGGRRAVIHQSLCLMALAAELAAGQALGATPSHIMPIVFLEPSHKYGSFHG
jgi:hypothetical protein